MAAVSNWPERGKEKAIFLLIARLNLRPGKTGYSLNCQIWRAAALARRSAANKKKAITKTAFSLELNNILAILLEFVFAVDTGAGERSDEEALGVDRFLAIFADAVFTLLNLS